MPFPGTTVAPNIGIASSFNGVLKDPAAGAAYERSVTALLNQINGNPVGKIIIGAIKHNAHRMLIIPYDGADQNAEADETSTRGAVDGTGSSVKVKFSPSQWQMEGVALGPGTTADAVLFHEMVHGLREMRGCLSTGLRMRNNMLNFDEFVAILVTNIYDSCLGRRPRGDHLDFPDMPSNVSDPARFVHAYLKYMDWFYSQMPDVAASLARINCAFNPIRVHLDYRARRRGL